MSNVQTFPSYRVAALHIKTDVCVWGGDFFSEDKAQFFLTPFATQLLVRELIQRVTSEVFFILNSNHNFFFLDLGYFMLGKG